MDKYVEAMERKFDIAEYHLAVLRELLPFSEPDGSDLPPMALQAHFEACGRAIVAMLDQLVSGIASVAPEMPKVHGASPKSVINKLSRSGHPKASELKKLIKDLDDDCRINDLRDIRNRSTHRFDEKEYLHRIGWVVKAAEYVPRGVPPYEGSRQLSEYLQAMIEYARGVLDAAQKVEKLAKTLAKDSKQ
ncbi:MAG: hypothetical protein IIC71_01845 [Acidobacteria bacterium]|nr:hypothetical protein [Acidobacteriota bacterium]